VSYKLAISLSVSSSSGTGNILMEFQQGSPPHYGGSQEGD